MRKEKLISLCDVKNGYAFKSSDYVDSGHRVIRITNVQKGLVVDDNPKFISERIAAKASSFKLKLGDILISLTGNVGRVGRIQACHLPAVLNQRVGMICPTSEDLDANYLFQYLNSDYFENDAIKNSNGVAQLNLSSKWIENHQIPLPPLAEQKCIAAILDKADAIRRKRQQAIKLADEFLRATFLDMFGDPVINPKGWPFGTIRELISEAKYGTAKKASIETGEYPILRMNNITYNGEMDFTDLKYIDLEEKEISKYIAKKGDLLFNRTNSKELVGKTAVFESSTPMAIAGYLIRVRSNERSTPHYISSYLNSSHGKATLMGMCKNIIGMANINAQELQNISIMVPPVDLQKQYTDLVWKVQERKKRQLEAANIGDTLFRSLTQRAFRGEL